MRKQMRLCDYVGYACNCTGYTQKEKGSSLCVCGHYKSQHQMQMRDHEPEEYMTPDGYRFFQYPDGRYGDNKDRKKADMIFESFDDLVREVKDEH